VRVEQHLKIAAGVSAEAFQVGEVIGGDDFRPFGDDPALPDNGLDGVRRKLGVDGVCDDVVEDIGNAERGQVLPGIPEYLGGAGGAFDSFVIDVHVNYVKSLKTVQTITSVLKFIFSFPSLDSGLCQSDKKVI
jgi:hypothetical protein